MSAERVARMFLRIAAALAAGFVVSVVVAWGPLVIAQEAVPIDALRAQGDLAQASRTTMVKASRTTELDFHAPTSAAAVTRIGGLVVAVRLRYFEVPDDIVDPTLPSIGRWSIDRAGNLNNEAFRSRLPSWIARDDRNQAWRATYGAGWPCVLFSAHGEPVEDETEGRAWPRGWLFLNHPPSGEMGRAIPLRLDTRGAVLNSVFYGVVLSALMVSRAAVRRYRSTARGVCVRCGYPASAPICPECGSPRAAPAGAPNVPARPTEGP